MADILFQGSFFVIQLICGLVVSGLDSLYFIYAYRQRTYPSATFRRRVTSSIGVVLLVLGIILFVAMLFLRLRRDGTLLNSWTLGFVLVTVVETTLLTFFSGRVVKRRLKMLIGE
jgi:hypothetical protein